MQTALEICIAYSDQGGFAYRQGWATAAGFKRASESPIYVGVKDGEIWKFKDADGKHIAFERYVPSIDDILMRDWEYEF
jgi:hypothetical protein